MVGMHNRKVRHSRSNRSESAIHDQQNVDMSKRVQSHGSASFWFRLQPQTRSNAFCHLVLSTWRPFISWNTDLRAITVQRRYGNQEHSKRVWALLARKDKTRSPPAGSHRA